MKDMANLSLRCDGDSMNPFIHLSKAHCCACNEDSIYLVTTSGNQINYSEIEARGNDNEMADLMNNVELSHMECKKCHTRYAINWANGWPEPILYTSLAYAYFLR